MVRRPRWRLGRVPRGFRELRRAAAKHCVWRHRRRNRVYCTRPHTDSQKWHWLAAGAGLDRRVRLDWLYPVRRAAAAQQPRLRSIRQRQQQNRVRPLSAFPVARLGSAEPGGADQRTACRRAASVAGSERRNPGRYAVDRGAAPGSADEPHQPQRRFVTRGDRAVAGLGLSNGCRRCRAAAVHGLAA